MKSIRNVYPGLDENIYFTGPENYGPLIKSLDHKIILESHDDGENYHGDSYYFLHDTLGNRYGVLIFGWGSCSGCDALQACDSYDEISELRDELANSIHWFDSLIKLNAYLATHDWEGDYSWKSEACGRFVRECKRIVEYLLGAKDRFYNIDNNGKTIYA